MASIVTCVDLWFNSCVEEQAFCRVFRIGQQSETFVTRFLVKDTVDERLEEMQEHKKRVIGDALDDRAILSKLSARDIMQLFGDIRINGRTKRPYIAMEDDERLDAILPPLPDEEEDPIVQNLGKVY
ncbi:MAG: hypothetical protein Q9163_002179 [Psora crenata]